MSEQTPQQINLEYVLDRTIFASSKTAMLNLKEECVGKLTPSEQIERGAAAFEAIFGGSVLFGVAVGSFIEWLLTPPPPRHLTIYLHRP